MLKNTQEVQCGVLAKAKLCKEESQIESHDPTVLIIYLKHHYEDVSATMRIRNQKANH